MPAGFIRLMRLSSYGMIKSADRRRLPSADSMVQCSNPATVSILIINLVIPYTHPSQTVYIHICTGLIPAGNKILQEKKIGFSDRLTIF